MRLLGLSALIILTLCAAAQAQDTPSINLPPLPPINVPEHPAVPAAPVMPALPAKEKVGMHHVRVTDPKQPEKDKSENDTTEQKQTQTDPAVIPNSAIDDDHVIKAPAPKVYFTPTDELKIWPKMSTLMANTNAKAIDDILKEIEASAAQASPMALFLAANAYTQRGELKKAAEAYYLAQLRAQFDKLRWPKDSPSSRKADADLYKMAELYGPPINAWVMADSKRLSTLIDDVKKRDAKTPYQYHPGHVMAFGRDEKEWPELHTKARSIFSTESEKIINALKTLGR